MKRSLVFLLSITLITPGLAFASKPGSMQELWSSCWGSAFDTRQDEIARQLSRSYCGGVLTGFAASIDEHDKDICLPPQWTPGSLVEDALEQLNVQAKAKFDTSLKDGLTLIFVGAYPCK